MGGWEGSPKCYFNIYFNDTRGRGGGGVHKIRITYDTARYAIMGNKSSFFQYILKKKHASILLQIFKAQIKHPLKNDWNREAKLSLTN